MKKLFLFGSFIWHEPADLTQAEDGIEVRLGYIAYPPRLIGDAESQVSLDRLMKSCMLVEERRRPRAVD